MRTVPENMRTYAIFSPTGPRSTLKTLPDTEPVRVPDARRQQLREAARQGLHARARDRRAEEHRLHERPLRLSSELRAKPAIRNARLVVDERGQERIVVLG